MRIFIGMIFGCLLTVGAAYVHDHMGAPAAVGGTQADTSSGIVNWDVAARKWGDITESAHTVWLKLQTIGDSPSPKAT
jgi:hypothetical protein